jgi:V/A-type H+-transporting ATPase subunit E
MGSDLDHLLEQEARGEIDAIRKEARTRADDVVASARRDAEEIVSAARRRAEGERAQALTRAASTAQLRAAALVLSAKDDAIRDVFQQAEAALHSLMADPVRRAATVRSLLREAVRDVAAVRVVEVAPQDVQTAREVCRELRLDAEVRENPRVVDGVRLTSPDGRAVVENTISGRLARARREMVSRVAEVLWGG